MKVTNEIANKWCDAKEVKSSIHSRNYMNVNVILTFDCENKNGDSQEMFDLKILVSKEDVEPIKFFHEKLFKQIVKKCKSFNRDVGDLIKISTCSNWSLYKSVTGSESLHDLGHSCKWYFGNGRLDLDPWEKNLIEQLGFGANIDMSWVNCPETRKACFLPSLSALELQS